MKLLNCLACNDILALDFTERKCLCLKSRGKYLTEKLAVYSGPSRVLGIRNPEYQRARPGEDYVWFVIPEGHNIRKT